jgi:hypothetical protein
MMILASRMVMLISLLQKGFQSSLGHGRIPATGSALIRVATVHVIVIDTRDSDGSIATFNSVFRGHTTLSAIDEHMKCLSGWDTKLLHTLLTTTDSDDGVVLPGVENVIIS